MNHVLSRFLPSFFHPDKVDRPTCRFTGWMRWATGMALAIGALLGGAGEARADFGWWDCSITIGGNTSPLHSWSTSGSNPTDLGTLQSLTISDLHLNIWHSGRNRGNAYIRFQLWDGGSSAVGAWQEVSLGSLVHRVGNDYALDFTTITDLNDSWGVALVPGKTYYLDMCLVTYRNTGSGDDALWFNGDNGSNYHTKFVLGTPPALSAAGVDANSFLLKWSDTGSANGYNAQIKTDAGSWPDSLVSSTVATNFAGWTTNSSAQTKTVTYGGLTYSLTSAYVYYTGTYGREIRMDTSGTSAFATPAMSGRVTRVTYQLRAGGSGNITGRTMTLQAKYPGEDSWTDLQTGKYATTNNAHTTFTYHVPGGLPSGTQIRWLNQASDSGTTILLKSFSIEMMDDTPGHCLQTNGLTGGTTYKARVAAAGGFGWSDELSVLTGVVPSSVASNGVTTNTATFTWTGHAGATGYRVAWTTNGAGDIVTAESAHETAGHAWPRECDTDQTGDQTLTTNGAFSAKGWRYWGASCQKDGGGAFSRAAPAYKDAVVSSTHHKGHFLVGDTVMGIESTNFPVAGATILKFSYTIKAWNLNAVRASLENGRVTAYYRLDDGPWCFLGSGVPSGTTDGNGTQQTWTLEKGMLDGTNVAFRVELAHGTVGYFTSDTSANQRMAGVYVQALKVYCTAKGEGDYTAEDAGSAVPATTSGSGTKTYTVNGFDPETPVYFRVQALQGENVKSVWVETNATTLPSQVVTFSTKPVGVTVGQTTTVAAAGAYESPTITYSIPSGSAYASIDPSSGLVTPIAAGTATIRATAGPTAHYADGTYAEYDLVIRPAPPATQATLSCTGRTDTGFDLSFTRGSGSGVLVLVKASSTPNAPTDGVGVAARNAGSSALTATSYGDAYAVVNYPYADNTEHTKPVTGATAGTHYYAAAYSYNHSGDVNAENLTYAYKTPGAECDFWTLATEPGTAATVSGAKAAVDGDTHATLTYNAGGAGNILLVMMKEADAAVPPVVDGVCYTNVASTNYGTSTAALGNGYIVYAGPAAAGSQTVAVAGLSGGTSYVVYAFPYNTAAGDDGGTSANYRAHTLSAAFVTEAAQGPEELDAETTRYTMAVSWKAMTPPAGKTVTGYTVEATACGGDGAVSTLSPTCPDNANLASTYDPTKATHGSTTEWSYRLSVKSASDDTHSYPGWNVNGQQGHELIGRWQTTANKPGIESPVIDLSGAASAKVQFDLKKYNSGTLTTYNDRTRVTLLYSVDGGETWTNGPTTGNAPASFATTNLAVPAEALTDNVKLMLYAASTSGYTETNKSKVIGPVVKAISVIQTAKATGDYATSGCPVPAANITVDGTNATVTGLSSNQLYYYRVKANYSDSTSSKWSESTATTKGQMAAPGATASAERYAGTVAWTAPAGESANVTAWHVEVTGCASGGADEPTTNACPDGALTVAGVPSEDAWTYTNRASGYPSWQKWGGYNGGAHFLVGTGGSASSPTPKGIVSEQLNLSGMGSAFVRFMHAPNLQNPVATSYITLYYSLDDGANWTKVKTLQDAGQVWPSLVYKELKIDIPDAALAEGVYMKLSADSAYQQVTESATNQFGARIEGIEVVATPLRQDWDFGCGSTTNYTIARGTSGFDGSGMDHVFTGLANATAYGYRVWATDEGGNASATNTGQFKTLAGQNPPVQIRADPVKQTQMKLQWDAAPEATVYEIQMTQCADREWERVVIAASPTNARLSALDDWSYIGGGTDVDAVDGVKLAETNYITEGGFYPTFADGGRTPENSQVLAGEGAPGMMSAVFSTVGATNAALSFNFGRWYVKGGLKNVDAATASNAAVLTAYYSLDGGESWENWFQTESATNYAYTYTGTYGTANKSLPAAALGQENVRIKLVAENACIMDVSTKAGSSYVTNHAVGVALALAQVKLQGVTGDYSSSGCRVDDGTWTVPSTAGELSILVTNLEANSNYYFRVRATDGETDPVQYGEWTDGAAKTPAAPDKVVLTNATSVGRYAFTANWQAAARAESYVLRVYTDSGCTTLQGLYPVDGLSARVTGLAANTTYWFKVTPVADGREWSGSTSDAGNQKTANAISITGLEATRINPTSMTIVWDGAGSGAGAQNILTWGEVGTDGGTGAVEETIECPAETLKRTDSGNGWFYVGGSASYPAYWVNSNNPTADQGHALIYKTSGVAPGIRSRWFDTYGATNVTVEFLHGRFNASANSAVELDYSLDGGENWTYAGTTPTSSASTPTDLRSIALPAAALNRKSVMIQLSAPGADGNKGAHVKDLKVRIRGRRLETGGGNKTWTGAAQCEATSWKLTGLTPGKRYWFALRATDDGNTWVEVTNTASTYAMRTGVLASQGFEDETTDTTPWATNIFWIPWRSTGWYTNATWEAGYPTVEVVENENPLYGRKALRMSGSAAANAFGVADFTCALGSRGGVVTIPFSAKDLAKDDYLYVAYKWSDGDWTAPGGADQTSMGGVPLTRIGAGGTDVPNRNWPYNRGVNTTTRPKGDAYSFEVPAGSSGAELTVRVAFCGQSGSANRYYYIDELALEEAAGIPDPVDATATSDGHVQLTWTSPEGQKVIIIRGQDMREPPGTGAPDLSALPEGYEVVMNGTETQWPAGAGSHKDEEATSGWRYYYYFYAVTASGTIGKTPAVAWTMVGGMVKAIASQGWDGWDVHPWNYRLGRVTNPGRSSDAGYWRDHGQNTTNSYVRFFENEFETDSWPARGSGSGSYKETTETYGGKTYTYRNHWVTNYATLYGATGDADRTNQLGVSTLTNYYGEHAFRLSGGGGTEYRGQHVYYDFDGTKVTNSDCYINTNNAAIEFANVDLSGYKNVEFQLHYAGAIMGGGNYLHVAISTNGGAEGTWEAVHNKASSGWAVTNQTLDYGLQLQEMSNKLVGETVNFYSQELVQYGNPFILKVPDSVTQFMARVMFYDSNGRNIGWRHATYFIDEVRLLGEVALETPEPVIDNVASNGFRVTWTNVPDADRYNLRVTALASNTAVKLAESFAVQGTLDWTAAGSVDYTATANRQGGTGSLGYGLVLDANGESLTSPAIGCAETLSFWASGASDTTAELSVQIGSGTAWETLWSATVSQIRAHAGAAESDGNWSRYEISLPHRQWQQIRFVKTAGSGQAWVDDIKVLGAGNYATTVFTQNGLTDTNCAVTGLESGTRYFVSVQAVEDVTDGGETYEIESPWGETADYTAGFFTAGADGFELVRMGWAPPGGGIVVIAVTNGDASAVATPAKDAALAVGTQVVANSAVVVTNGTTATNDFEHVWPYKGNGAAAQYVVFWKHGSYWEGRLETNVATGVYVCQAADAFAVTNETFIAGNTGVTTPAATPFGGGKGWNGNWELTVTHGGSWHAVDAVRDGTPEGLIETNQLWGAGGNMLAFRPGDDTHANSWVGMRRKLATPLGATSSDEWWGMFAMKIDWQGSGKWAGLKLLDSTGTDVVAIGKVEGGDNAAIKPHNGTATRGGSTIANGATNIFVFRWKNGKMSLHVEAVGPDWAGWDPSVAAALSAPNSWTWQVADCTVSTMAEVHYVMLEAANISEYVNNVHFDEIRIGPDWPSLIGKQELPPLPAYDVLAVPDGNEMVRLSWKYKPGGQNADGSSNPLMEHANGVTVIETTDPDGVTAEETEALRDAALGATFGNATVIATHAVAAATAAEEMDHVVLPGTTHRYAVVARNGGAHADAAASGAAEMGSYAEREWLNPFSYTNNVEFASAYPSDWATTYRGTWKGGQGFETGQTQHYWAKGGSGTWTPVKPSVADAAVHITNAIANYWPSAGNVMKFVPGDQTSGYLKRNLNSAWCGNANDTFYTAFRMAYQYNGNNKWAGLRFIDNGGNDAHSILFGKVGTASAAAGIAGVSSGSSSEGNWAGAAGSLDDYGNSADQTHAYLVVGKVQWTASGTVTASLYVLQTGAGGASLPTSESDITWTVTQSGLQLRNVNQFQLEAGATSGNGNIGEVYFDEIRFGTTWDDIVGPADPTDVRMALLDGESDSEMPGSTAWKGDLVSFGFESQPAEGKKQTAAGWLTYDDGTTWTEAAVATNIGTNTGWVQWRATNVQLTAAGTVRAGGSVAGSSVTMESWERTENARRYRAYTVRGLNPPTDIHAEGGVLRNLFDWTQWTDSGRTFEQVMVVRFDNTVDRDNWTPADGTAYAQGVTYNSGKVVYVGTDTNCVDTGLARNQEYWYAFYTVNNDYYSLAATAECTTLDEDVNVPDIDGDPTDWVGVPSVVKNSSTVSANEFIWTDKIGEERKDTDACQSADLKEFRVKADATDVYFLVRLSGGEATAATNAYAAVALTTSGLADGNADGEKWIGAPGNTLMGGAYWQTNASLHHADREMAVHYVAGAEKPWQVEIWDKNGGHWYATTNWAAAGSAAGAADACIEWRVPRDTLGLDYAGSYCMTGRFTVATFVNSGIWNNQGAGTAQIGDNGKSRAVDAMAIAPYGQDDKDLSLGAWEEGLREKEVPFWADVRFDSGGVHLNEAPRAPTGGTPNGESQASPTMAWTASSDRDNQHYEGFVTGYFLEVATNATYNGVGDGTENGPIAYRVNLGADTTSRRFVTDGAEYWWRVRARDNSGELSAPGEWHYVVTGKKDNAGPVAKLLYVGTNVMQFLEDSAYRAEEERSGDATSVLDSELEDGGHEFGFVVEWYDASGVYAKNQMRKWQTGDCAWPDAGKPVGSFAWNVYATHEEHPEIPFGRVSPNWDLMIVDRWSTTRPPDEVVGTNRHGYTSGRLTLPMENGGTEEVDCWYIDCGFDTVFWEDEMIYNGNTGLYLTNYVTNAFSISTYRPGVELYLTVSAEDCCQDTGDSATSGDAGWYEWPSWNTHASPWNPGSWKGIEKEWQDSKLSGWCADGPHMGRNVTTNQLLKFYVRDNDVIPPVASTEKWKDTATNAANAAFYPFMAAAIGVSGEPPSEWDPTWDALESIGLLPVVEGIGRGATYRLTDEDLDLAEKSDGKLRFFFNVYDEYIHSGVKRGTGDPDETVHKDSPPSDRSLTNSAFFARTWDATADDGAGAWVDGATTNRTNFASNWSKICNLDEVGTEFMEGPGEAGTGPSTVLAWEFDASLATAESLFGMEGLFAYIATNSAGVTNKLMLEAWDSDNNGEGDQAHDNVEFGRLVFRDDDTTPPTAPSNVTVTVGGTAMTAENPIWTNQITSISLSFDAASDPDTVEGGMHANDTHGSGVDSYRVARTDATGVGIGTHVTTSGSETLSATLAEGAAISEGLATNYLFAVDRDADREGDALAGEAVGFVTAYDATRPTSVAANSFTADSSNEDDPTSMMRLAWEEPEGGMGPDDFPTGSRNRYSPWETYQIRFATYTATSDNPQVSDNEVQDVIKSALTEWHTVTASSNEAYRDLGYAATTNILLVDLEPGEHYVFEIVGQDLAGNKSASPRYAVGDTIKFMVTQGVMRAWGTLETQLNTKALGGAEMFVPTNNVNIPRTPALYWDARIDTNTPYWDEHLETNTYRASRGYSLVYRDDTVFREGKKGEPLHTPGGHAGWGDKAGNSISNNFYAEPDGNAQRLGEQNRGMMRFYRATYAGREYAEGGVIPLASEEVYALHNVKLTQGRNFVALHGVPYTNTFAGVFGTDTTYWPAGSSMGDSTRVEFFDGGLSFYTNSPAGEVYYLDSNGRWKRESDEKDVTFAQPGVLTNGPRTWYTNAIDTGDNDIRKWYPVGSSTGQTNQPALDDNFFTRGFALTLPPRSTGYYDTSEAQVRIVEKGANGFQTTNYVPVFNWSPILQMPTNDAAHQFTVTVKCGTNSVVPFGLTNFTKRTAVDTLVAFRAPVSVHPRQLGLPLVANTDTTTNGFTYNLAHPELGDRLLIMAAASKDARIRFDESECGNASHSLGSLSQMYYDGATEKWRWFDKGNSSDPEVTGWPIKPNDALVIRSCNGGTHTNWTWSYTPTNLYDAADRHFGY